jgi:hypothetical protein
MHELNQTIPFFSELESYSNVIDDYPFDVIYPVPAYEPGDSDNIIHKHHDPKFLEKKIAFVETQPQNPLENPFHADNTVAETSDLMSPEKHEPHLRMNIPASLKKISAVDAYSLENQRKELPLGETGQL